jgi:hypothetical protein
MMKTSEQEKREVVHGKTAGDMRQEKERREGFEVDVGHPPKKVNLSVR